MTQNKPTKNTQAKIKLKGLGGQNLLDTIQNLKQLSKSKSKSHSQHPVAKASSPGVLQSSQIVGQKQQQEQ